MVTYHTEQFGKHDYSFFSITMFKNHSILRICQHTVQKVSNTCGDHGDKICDLNIHEHFPQPEVENACIPSLLYP